MPFQSEKQRRYLHANHPEIAKRWERDYGEGGIAALNAQLNQLPEYYLRAANGGILGLNESEEIIDDDGNDIELTAYNAAFDDPNDLSTGVKTLFQAKDGGNIRLQPHTATDLLAKKNPDGTRSKYQPPGYKDAPAHHGDVAHGPGGRFDQPSAPEKKTPATISTPTGGDQEDDTAEMMRKMDLQDIIERGPGSDVEKYDTWEQQFQGKWPGQVADANQPFFNIQKQKGLLNYEQQKWEAVRDSTNKKLKNMVGKKIVTSLLTRGVTLGISDIISVMLTGFKQNKAKKEFIGVIKNAIKNYQILGIPEHSPHTDTLIQKLNQQLLDLTKKRVDEEPHDRPEPTIELLKKTEEEIEDWDPTDWFMSLRARMKANQAKRAMLVQKGIIQDSPIIDESVADITMQANRGGLANLFRVKNQ